MYSWLKDGSNLIENEFLAGCNLSDNKRLLVSVDTVIISVDSGPRNENFRKLDKRRLIVLLVRRDADPFTGMWSLPGGFVGPDESLDEAARRVLRDKTGLDDVYIEQLYTFGEPGRDPRMRIVSCAYLSLVDRGRYAPGETDTGPRTAWFEIEFGKENADAIVLKSGGECLTIPVLPVTGRNGRVESKTCRVADGSALAFDHAELILEGLLRLRDRIANTDIAFNLMPEMFTFSELQQVFEIILGQKLLTPQFRRTVAPKLESTESYTRDKGHRPSRLFTYKKGI